MQVDFKFDRVDFYDFKVGEEYKEDHTFHFATALKEAKPILSGFKISYEEEHWLKYEEISLKVSPIDDEKPQDVTVQVKFGLADGTGDIDDRYFGYVDFGVIVKREDD